MVDRRFWPQARRIVSACALASALIGTSVAVHAEDRDRRPRGPAGMVARHAEELGLDAPAREQIDDIMRRSGERHDELRGKRRDARMRLRELLERDEPQSRAVLEQAEALGALETEMQKNRLGAILEIREMLTPEQRRQLARIRSREFPERGRRRGPLRRCGGDLRERCPEARTGPEVLSCLQANWDALSDRCRSGFDAQPPRRPDSR